VIIVHDQEAIVVHQHQSDQTKAQDVPRARDIANVSQNHRVAMILAAKARARNQLVVQNHVRKAVILATMTIKFFSHSYMHFLKHLFYKFIFCFSTLSSNQHFRSRWHMKFQEYALR
jgi:hypothetical protein